MNPVTEPYHCSMCSTGIPNGTAYRPHLLTPDCWCQEFKRNWTESLLTRKPRVCAITRDIEETWHEVED